MAELGTMKVKVNFDHESLRKSVHDILHGYSEWLDGEKLMTAPKPEDRRSHDDLVSQYLDQRYSEGG